MGSRQKNIIEINGKKYDAATGRMLSATKTTKIRNNVGVIDGFVRKPKRTHTTTQTSSVSPVKPRKSRQPASHTAKTPQKSKTLMRSAVKKPVAQIKTTKPTRTTAINKTAMQSSPRRKVVAATSQKSTMVSRYSNPAARSSVVKKVQHMPVKKHTVKRAPSGPPAQAIRTAEHAEAYAKAHRPTNKAAAKFIEKALENATSHEHPPVELKRAHKKRSRLSRRLGLSAKAISLSASALAFVLLAGFFAVQNVPNLSMRVASARAGFGATMPGYNPSGFSFKGPINYSAGRVTVSFGSNTDDREYTLTQRASNWNSEALRSNFITAENKQYQTYVDKGRTLYIYDGSNATWVDDGIWYQVEGQSQMTTDQLVRIASSM